MNKYPLVIPVSLVCLIPEIHMVAPLTYSLQGKGLKLNTAADVAEFCTEMDAVPGLTEICLSGNTFGVEAAKAISKSIAKQTCLKVVFL